MRLIVFLSQNCFLAGAILFVWAGPLEGCDTKWIRHMFLLTCGRKKRELSNIPDEILDKAPSDFDRAFRYFRKFNPDDPFLMNETVLKQQIDKDNEKPSSTPLPLPLKILLARRQKNEDVVVELSGLSKKLEIFEDEGIQSFPRKWNFRDLTHTNTNFQSNLMDDLIEACCNGTKRNNCTPDRFLELCK